MRLDLSNLDHAFLLGLAAASRAPLFECPELAKLVEALPRAERPIESFFSQIHQANADRWDKLSPEGVTCFARGIASAHGHVSIDDGYPRLVLPLLPSGASELVARAAKSSPQKTGQSLVWQGVAAQDALGAFIEGGGPQSERLNAALALWCTTMTHVEWRGSRRPEILVQRTHEDAVIPGKERVSDSGYDLTLLYVKKTLGPTTLFGTGIIIEPPHGWYLDVVPRSSIIKRGYTLANNVGIIDRSYRGEVFVPLLKVDPDAPELELPARVAQLIPRPIVHFPVRERNQLSSTDRGAGGFGSTGN